MLSSRAYLATFKIFLVVTSGIDTGIWWDAVLHPAMHRTTLYKRDSQPKMLIGCAVVEKPSFTSAKLSSVGNVLTPEFCHCSNRLVLNKTSWVKHLKMLLKYWGSIQLETFSTPQITKITWLLSTTVLISEEIPTAMVCSLQRNPSIIGEQ